MNRSVLSALGLAATLVPAAALAQSVSGGVSVGNPAGSGVAQVQGEANAGVAAPPMQAAPQAAPVYVQQPPPGYAYPQPAYVVPVGRARRRVIPYAGGPVPPNGHLEEQPITGLVIAGGILFGLSYVPSAITALVCTSSTCSNSGIPWLGVPVLGPLIALGFPQSEEGARVLVLDAIMQIGGAAMFIAGFAARNRVIVIDEYAHRDRPRNAAWTLVPGAPGAPAGLSLNVTHF